MVDQKIPESVQDIEVQQGLSRRNFLRGLIGGGALLATGGVILLNRSTGEPAEPTATSAPQAGTSGETLPQEQTTLPGNAPETTEAFTTTTVPRETFSLSPEKLPTSVEDPELWVGNIYAIINAVYNGGDYQLLDYIVRGGEKDAIIGRSFKDRAEQLSRSQEQGAGIQITGRFIEAQGTLLNGGGPITVEETLSAPGLLDPDLYPNGEERRIVDYFLTPPIEVPFDNNGTTELVPLYLVGGMTIVCTYNRDGVCQS